MLLKIKVETETHACCDEVKVKTEACTSSVLQVEAPDPTGGGQEQEMVGGDQQVSSSFFCRRSLIHHHN